MIIYVTLIWLKLPLPSLLSDAINSILLKISIMLQHKNCPFPPLVALHNLLFAPYCFNLTGALGSALNPTFSPLNLGSRP